MEEAYWGPRTGTRIESGPIGPYVARLAEILCIAGYRPSTIIRHLRAADKFGRWLKEHNLALAEANAAVIERYISSLGRLPHPTRLSGRLPDAAFGPKQLLAVLIEQRIVQPEEIEAEQGPLDELLISFRQYLDRTLGVSTGTQQTYLRYARLFLESLGGTTLDLSQVTADVSYEFVREQAAKLKTSSCQLPVCSLRAFLRFLTSRSLIREGLDRAVPTVRQWKLASLPKHLSEDELARVLNACDTQTPTGLRDRAILTLLARLGLRAGEASRLGLDDIDWKEGQILIRAGKSHRERILPLAKEVGRALVAYLKRGRPNSSQRMIFLRSRPPYTPLKNSGSISSIAKSYLKRAGLASIGCAAHALRHTAATGLVAKGASFKEVADILGHQRLATTAIYAKLDIERLAQVTLPWPGGDQ